MTAVTGSIKSLLKIRSGSAMMDISDHLDQWESEFERRTINRTRISKGAILFFSARSGVHACLVRNVTDDGAGIRAQDLRILPLNFNLSFDNFRTNRNCRLIWREGDFIGLAFES